MKRIRRRRKLEETEEREAAEALEAVEAAEAMEAAEALEAMGVSGTIEAMEAAGELGRLKKQEEAGEDEDSVRLPIAHVEPIYWEHMLLLYESALEEIRTKVNVLTREFKLKNGYSPIEHITTRIKRPESIFKKMKKKKLAPLIQNVVQYVNDIAGVRIICSYTSDIYSIAGMLSNQEDVTVLSVKDYIANPKPNGYQSYHMIVTVPVYLSDCVKQTKVEIQIRTSAMDFWASLEHKMNYKYAGQLPPHIKRELKECADIAAFLDRKMLALHEEILQNDEEEKERQVGIDISVEKNIWQIF